MDWWPCELNLAVLRQNTDETNPLGGDFDYPSEFAKLDGRYFQLDHRVRITVTDQW